MNEPLGVLMQQFVRERTYLKAVTAKTRVWYQTAFKAFQATPGDEFSKQRLQAFVVLLRERTRVVKTLRRPQAPIIKPVHDWTSHMRTMTDYYSVNRVEDEDKTLVPEVDEPNDGIYD